MIDELLLGLHGDGPAPLGASGGAAAAGRAIASDVERQQTRVGAVELAVEALFRLGVEEGFFTEQEFIAMARKIDLEDGVIDGRRDINKLRRLCPNCQKANAADRVACMWCGGDLSQAQAEPVPSL